MRRKELRGTMMADEPTHADFFISYTGKDSRWAEWIAMQLEEAGYHTIIQAWDFRPGSNFVAEMDEAEKRAERILPVLSAAYLASDYAFAEWATAFRRDPKGKQGRVLPVRIERCEVEGQLGPIVYIDLVDLDEPLARERLLAGVQRGRAKPVTVAFPASASPPVPLDRPVFPGSLPPIWNIPYPRNSFFIGRDEILTRLRTQLQSGQATALSQPQAITGLGGIGKTQIAVEYAYRFHQDYQVVLWARAEDTEALTSSFITIATLLNLAEQKAQDQTITVDAVKTWLQTHSGWLLILDNADDLNLLPAFLPPALGGHLLLTTRAFAVGRLASRLEVDTLSAEQGALFLLRRASLMAPDATLEHVSPKPRDLAIQVSQELGGLPLALDQAGAYLEATGTPLAAYQQIYQRHRTALLAQRRAQGADHPEPVASTWSLSFARVEETNPAAADLLRLCAYLAPDAIAEEILTQGAEHLGAVLGPVAADGFLLGQAIEALRAYSLIRRDPSLQTLSVHRLVQAVVRDALDAAGRQIWAERAIRAVHAALPPVEHASWPHWERLLAHAQACATWLDPQEIHLQEAAEVLQQAGWYVTERARYSEAEPLLERAYQMSEQLQGAEHLDTARDASTLASLYRAQGKYEQAEPLYVRALAVCEQQLGPEHPHTALSLNNLAHLYYAQGKYEQAEPLLVRALAINEQQLGPEHPDTALSLNSLALLYKVQGKYEQAEPLYVRALAIREQQVGPLHPSTASSLNNLATLYYTQGKDEQAEPLYVRALAICEQQLGPLHPQTQITRRNYVALLRRMGRDAEARAIETKRMAPS
jgi:tetratricopeptide (TPR) repeat protein